MADEKKKEDEQLDDQRLKKIELICALTGTSKISVLHQCIDAVFAKMEKQFPKLKYDIGKWMYDRFGCKPEDYAKKINKPEVPKTV